MALAYLLIRVRSAKLSHWRWLFVLLSFVSFLAISALNYIHSPWTFAPSVPGGQHGNYPAAGNALYAASAIDPDALIILSAAINDTKPAVPPSFSTNSSTSVAEKPPTMVISGVLKSRENASKANVTSAAGTSSHPSAGGKSDTTAQEIKNGTAAQEIKNDTAAQEIRSGTAAQEINDDDQQIEEEMGGAASQQVGPPGSDQRERVEFIAKRRTARAALTKFRPALFPYAKRPTKEAFRALVREYLAPWLPLTSTGAAKVPVTQRMLNVMEYAYKGGAFRVRIHNGKVYYRKLVHWAQTYRTQRMAWYLTLLSEMAVATISDPGDSAADGKTPLIPHSVDFVLYVGDGAKVAADTFTTEAGFPLFSLRTSLVHIDIPVPDPVSHGSNGNYQWNDEGRAVPWGNRADKLVFRGRGSCLKMQADNWHACDRVRLQKLSKLYPDELDAGIIDWNQIYRPGGSHPHMIYPPASIAEVEGSTGLQRVQPMSMLDQSYFKYILDVDGGLGSSRKPGILSSGSVLFSQQSPWYTFYEPLLEPYRHYVPVDRWLRDVREQVLWARTNDTRMHETMQAGRAFEAKFLTRDAAKEYMAILLEEYAALLSEPVPADAPIDVDFCATMENEEIRNGPMGCSQGWQLFTGVLPEVMAKDGKP